MPVSDSKLLCQQTVVVLLQGVIVLGALLPRYNRIRCRTLSHILWYILVFSSKNIFTKRQAYYLDPLKHKFWFISCILMIAKTKQNITKKRKQKKQFYCCVSENVVPSYISAPSYRCRESPEVVFSCLHITPFHYQHYAEFLKIWSI